MDPILETTTESPNGHATRKRSVRPEATTGGPDYIELRRNATKALHAERERLAKRIEQIDAELGTKPASMAEAAAAAMLAPTRKPRKAKAAALPRRFETSKPKAERLPRRSAEDIAESLKTVVDLLKDHPEGLRAEQIREKLQIEAKALPRVLRTGLESAEIRCSGSKRATLYVVNS